MGCGRGPAVAATILLAACGTGDDDAADSRASPLSDRAVIEYHYGDSSVPPEFHRSYTLTIRPDDVHVVVDSYGDVLEDTTVPLPAGVWSQLADADDVRDIGQLDIDQGDDGCSGGTSRSLEITDQGEPVVDTRFGVCGDVNTDAATRLDAYVQPVIDSIPNWDHLIE